MGIKKVNKNFEGPIHPRVRCPECKRTVTQSNGTLVAHYGINSDPCPVSEKSVREYLKMKAFKEKVVKLEAANGESVLLDLTGKKVETDNVEILFTVPATVKAVKSY
jgi:hypothetical protein